MSISRVWLAVALLSIAFSHRFASADESGTKRYSPQVESKAEAILEQAGLRVSGHRYAVTDVPQLSKTLSLLGRDKRMLRMIQDQWRAVDRQMVALNASIRQKTVQRGQLSIQLTKVVPGDTMTNNRIVGLLNANNASGEQLRAMREKVQIELQTKRGEVNEAEAAYTDTVLTLRRDLDSLQQTLQSSLETAEVTTAMRVFEVNQDVAPVVDAGELLAALDRRLQKVEQDVFREDIPLEARGKALFANVVIGSKSVSMVVDTGASLICLPAATADELGIERSISDPEIILRMADGRTISARKVVLSKVRVGTFEAEDVDAAVMPADAVAAEPLLGMTYLGNFRSEIDAAAKTLRLGRIE